MAIKVQGTTVIDDSRNLKNLLNLNNSGNVYANTFIGDGSQLTGLPASGGSFEATASGTLSDGSVVVVNSDGTVSTVSTTPVSQSVGSPVTLPNNGNTYDFTGTYDANADKVVVYYTDASNSYRGTAVVGTVSGSSITFGTPVAFTSGGSERGDIVYDSANQKVVIAYKDDDNDDGRAIVGTVSGTSISFGTAAQFESQRVQFVNAVYDSASGKVVIAYRNRDNSDRGDAVVGTVSGTSISFGSGSGYGGSLGVSNVDMVYDSNAEKVVIIYQDLGNSNYATAVVGTVSGTSVSYGTEVVYNSGAPGLRPGIVYDSSAQKVVVVYEDSNRGEARVGTVSGTDISFGSEVTFQSGTERPQYMQGAYDSVAGKVVIAYRRDNNSSSPYNEAPFVVTGTVSGTSISFSSPVELETDPVQNIGVFYDPSSGKVIIGYRDQGDSDKGKYVVWQNSYTGTNLTSENYIGISSAAYANGQTATIQIKGSVDDAQSSLTPGKHYFIQKNGSLNTTANTPSVFAGTAIASNKLIVKG